MGEEGLHQAAQKRRDRAKAQARADGTAAKSKAAKAVRSSKRVKQYRIKEALAEAGVLGKVVTTAALCIGLFGPMLFSVIVWGSDGFLALLATVAVSAVCAFAMASLGEGAMAWLRLSRLTRIGHGFDVDAYLAALGENRHSAAIEVRVTFAKPWADDARASASDAVKEWLPTVTRVEWKGDALIVRREDVSGTIWLSGGDTMSSGRHFDNRAIHGELMRIVDDVLPHLEEVAPIATLAVAIEGSIAAWDADP